jgi:hypothetical protein
MVDQYLNLVGRTLVAKETQNNPDRFFSDNIIDAGLDGQLPNQLVHIGPPSAPITRRILACELILIFRAANYKR